MDPELNPRASRQIPVARPCLSNLEAEEAAHSVTSGWISQGPKVEQFEEEFAAAHGRKYGVACCSGTSALQLALAALIATGELNCDEDVLCPTLTMVAVPNSILYVDCQPSFMDSEEETGNPVAPVHRKVLPSVAIVPHLYGIPAQECVLDLLERDVIVIEDCAEAHYAEYYEGAAGMAPVGSYGRFACFSFYANKIITSGEGGMVLTDSVADAELLRSLRSHAFTPGDHFHHQRLAYGMRMTDLQAAVGLAQHRRAPEFLVDREVLAGAYLARLEGTWGLTIPKNHVIPGSVWWVYPIQVSGQFDSFLRDDLRAHLAHHGIDTRTFFHPMHLQPHLRRFAHGQYPIAEIMGARGLYLPLYPGLSLEDVSYVCDAIKSFHHFRR